MLQSAYVLIHCSESRELVFSCDASPYGVGTVLLHVLGDGTKRTIAFVSHTLNVAERGHAHVDKEGLAAVFGVKKVHQCLYG